MLRERLKTAGIAIPPLLAVLYFGGWPLVALAFVTALTIIVEFLAFSTQLERSDLLQRAVTISLIPTGYISLGWSGVAWGIVSAVLLLFGLEILSTERERHDPQFTNSLSASLVCLCYAGVLGTTLLAIAVHPQGHRALFWLMMTVFLSDTGAYFGGKYFGGAPLSPRISPKKTQSGSICGIISGVIGSLLACAILGNSSQWLIFVLFGLIASVLGQIGDLAESLLKRQYGVKDSGSILPGHGGVLDRIDALLFAAPILFFGPFG